MGTDRYAYLSRLRRMDPGGKILLSLVAVVVCLLCGGVLTGLATLFVMGALTVLWGGVPLKALLRFLRIPLVFLLIGCLPALIARVPEGGAYLLGAALFGSVWGVTWDSLLRAGGIFSKALGVISAMYFLALNTPMTDLTLALGRAHVPRLFIELMELIYRFIFVLADTAANIRVAQESRLGYVGFRRSVDSLGALCSMVFLRAWRKADRIYSALESRGYTDRLVTLEAEYRPGRVCLPLAAGVAAAQLGIRFLERGLLR